MYHHCHTFHSELNVSHPVSALGSCPNKGALQFFFEPFSVLSHTNSFSFQTKHKHRCHYQLRTDDVLLLQTRKILLQSNNAQIEQTIMSCKYVQHPCKVDNALNFKPNYDRFLFNDKNKSANEMHQCATRRRYVVS